MKKVNNKKATRFSRMSIVKNSKHLNKHFFAGGKCLLNALKETRPQWLIRVDKYSL
jgi:hypothetical protein